MASAGDNRPLVPFQNDPDLSEWRAEIQETIYSVLEEWNEESKRSLMAMRSAREALEHATNFGSYADLARMYDVLAKHLNAAIEAAHRISGQLDPPSQVAIALNQYLTEKSARGRILADLDSVQREQLLSVLRVVAGEARKMLPPGAAITEDLDGGSSGEEEEITGGSVGDKRGRKR